MAFDFNLLNLEFECDQQTQQFSEDVRNIVSSALTGNIFQNPVDSLIQGSKLILENNAGLANGIGDALSTIANPAGPLTDATNAINGFTKILSGDPSDPNAMSLSGALDFAQGFTDRLSGKLIDNEGTMYQMSNAVGIAATYNNIVNNLRLPEQDLIDNFSPAFKSILQDGGGAMFASVQALNSNITGILGEYADVADWAQDINRINDFVNSITDATQAIAESITNVMDLIQSGKDFIDNALALIKRYGLAQLAISSVLNDPCFTGELLQNVVGTPELKKSLEVVKQVGVI